MAIEKKISEVELLEQISSNTNVVCEQDGSWKRVNLEALLPSKKDAEFENSISMGRTENSDIGEGSVALGSNVQAIGKNSTALGENNIAGCKGYYIKSIDMINRKIYLCNEKILPVISEDDNTDASFETPAYEVGDLFNIINDYHYMLCASITSVSNNVISYEGNLGFTEIVEDSGEDGHTFSIPSKPSIGVVNITYGCFVDGENNSAIGRSSLVSGSNNMAVGYYSHVEGRDNITGYSSHAEGYFNKALSIACHAEGGNNEVNGDFSHVEGTYNQANGNVSHAEGKSNIVEGYSSHAEGEENLVKGNISHAEGKSNEVSGSFSHSEGYDNVINNCSYSHVEGVYNEINSNVSHVEGQKNKAIGSFVHAEGAYNIAKGDVSHVEGSNNQANGDISHAEGTGNIANGHITHVEGKNNIAKGYCSHVEGKFNVEDIEEKYAHIVGNGNSNESRSNAHTLDWNGNAWYAGEVYVGGTDKDKGEKLVKESELPKLKSGTGEYSIIQCGVNNTASGKYSSAFGYGTNAIGSYSHAEGDATVASGYGSHAEGNETEASGSCSHAEGNETVASGLLCSHAEGNATVASGSSSHAEGRETVASGSESHAEGYHTVASGYDSHAEGRDTKASNNHSHAEGYYTEASGSCSHAEGQYTKASKPYSHAEGYYTEASGSSSHAEGYYTVASGTQSHAEGCCTKASGAESHAEGKYNIEDTESKYAHIVGNGNPDESRSNAHTLDWQGNAWYQGSITSNGADYAEYFEWEDGNLNNEDRVGLLVTLDGEKIKLANTGDEIIGIISGTAAVLGDNYECEWNGKYLTDDFSRVIYDLVEEFVDVEYIEFKEVEKEVIDEETNEVRIETKLEEVKTTEKKSLGFWKHPRLNPDYDPEQKYINRSDRPEWDTVGMLGKLYVRDDGTCEINGYATVGENGVATASLEKSNMRVLSRVNENVIRVLLK